MTKKSELEETLALLIRAEGLPEPVREYRFNPTRRFRFDFAWPDLQVAVECQGGIYSRGAHSRGTGLERDYEKMNSAQLMGWIVFQFSRKMIEDGTAIETIKNVMI